MYTQLSYVELTILEGKELKHRVYNTDNHS